MRRRWKHKLSSRVYYQATDHWPLPCSPLVVLSKPHPQPGEGNHIPRRDGEIRGYFPSASVVDKSSAKKEDVTSEESDSELSRFVLNKCTEVLDPTTNSSIVGVYRKAVSDPAERDEVEDADRPISRGSSIERNSNRTSKLGNPDYLSHRFSGASGMECKIYLGWMAPCELVGTVLHVTRCRSPRFRDTVYVQQPEAP